jgi:peptide/nickel transport system permease protein
VTVVDGREVRDFPRLAYGGAQLTDPASQWAADVLERSALGCVLGLAATVAIALGIAALRGRRGVGFGASVRELMRGDTGLPWRSMLLTTAGVLAFAGWIAALWPHYHVFGTDITGNDVLFQTLKSIRTAVVIGTLSSAATLPLAVALGILSGYYRGWVDDLIQYLYTVLSSIPSVLLIAALVLLIQVWIDKNPQWFDTGLERAEFRLFLLCIILGITGWSTLCRLLRAETLKLSQLEFVQASRAFGVADLRIMATHVLPNVMHLVLIVTVLDFSSLVLYEAVLSYVGVGVDPSTSSFGSMINLARTEMSRDPPVWWNLGAAFAFMLAVVLAANLFSDAVRDAFDPRARALRPRRRAAPVAAVDGTAGAAARQPA